MGTRLRADGTEPESGFSLSVTLDEDNGLESVDWNSYPYTVTDVVVKAGPECERISVDSYADPY